MSAPGPSGGFTLPRLAIDRDGVWHHEGQEITHPGILRNLWSNLRMDEGGPHVQAGPMRIPVEVADAPFVVVRLEADAAEPAVVLNDGTREALRIETVRLGAGEVPYCRVKDGRFEARLSRGAAWTLLRHVETDAAGQVVLVLAGRRHVLGRAPESPGA